MPKDPNIGEVTWVEGQYGSHMVYTYTSNGWKFTSIVPGSGTIQPTDSPIEWVLGAWKTPFKALDDIAVLGFAKFVSGKGGWGIARGMGYKEATQLLKTQGWEFVRSGKGSHMIWKSPSGTTFPIPNHKELSIGLISSLNKVK